MSKWQFDIDLSKANPAVLKEYQKLESIIENFLKAVPQKDMTEMDHEVLSGLLAKRVKIMNRLFKKDWNINYNKDGHIIKARLCPMKTPLITHNI